MPSFTDRTITPNTTQTDTMATMVFPTGDPNPAGVSKALYVAWNTSNRAPTVLRPNFSNNLIMVTGTGNGGATWTAPQIVSDGGNVPPPNGINPAPHFADPQIVFSQGSASGGTPGGQLMFVWNDFTDDTFRLDSSQPDSGVATNLAASSYQFSGTTGSIVDAGRRVNGATVVTGGTGYSLGDILTVVNTPAGLVAPPTAGNDATLQVVGLGATGPVVISNGGTGYKAGDTLTFVGGTGTATTITVGTVDSNGVILTASIASAGNYSVLPPDPNAVSGGNGTGAVIGVTFSVVTAVTVVDPGSYIVPPPNPVSVTGGTGSGATFNLTLGAPTPDLPTTTTFTDAVTIPANFTVNDLSVTLDVSDANLNELDVQLVSPSGTIIQLFKNQTDGLGNTISPAQGISGANLGEITTNKVTFLVGTAFDDNAPRSIADGSFAAPYIGRFTAEAGAKLDGATVAGQAGNSPNISGTWTLVVTDHKNEGETSIAAIPVQNVDRWTLNFSHISTTGFGTDQTAPVGNAQVLIPDNPVAGAAIAPYGQVNVGPFGPEGVGPGLSIAIDNSLGAFSPYEGTIYIAYTGIGGGGTNTNVYLLSGTAPRPNRRRPGARRKRSMMTR